MARKARVCLDGKSLPDFAEDLAAYAFFACLTAGHDAARGGHYADAKSALYTLDLVAADIDAAAGARNARKVADSSFVVGTVLQVHAQHVAATLFSGLVVGNIALFLQNAGDLGLQLRGRNIQLLVARTDGIAQARQEICYWIGKAHRFSFIPRSLCLTENLRECLAAISKGS